VIWLIYGLKLTVTPFPCLFLLSHILFILQKLGEKLGQRYLNKQGNGLGLGTDLFVKVPRPGDLFGLPNQAATSYYQSNHSKVESIPLSALPKETTSELAGLSPH